MIFIELILSGLTTVICMNYKVEAMAKLIKGQHSRISDLNCCMIWPETVLLLALNISAWPIQRLADLGPKR